MPTDSPIPLFDAMPIRLDWRLALTDAPALEPSSSEGGAPDGVHLMVADISPLLNDRSLQAEALQAISSHRRVKAEACSNPRNRALSIGVALLLDRLLAEYGLRESEMTYAESEHGKPSFANHPELLFNLSHSGSLVAAALLRNASESSILLGIDLQRVTRYRPEIVRRMFSATDRALLASATDEAERERLFAQCWSRAEAYAKATGTGLQWPFAELPTEAKLKEFCLENEDASSGLRQQGSAYRGCICLLQHKSNGIIKNN